MQIEANLRQSMQILPAAVEYPSLSLHLSQPCGSILRHFQACQTIRMDLASGVPLRQAPPRCDCQSHICAATLQHLHAVESCLSRHGMRFPIHHRWEVDSPSAPEHSASDVSEHLLRSQTERSRIPRVRSLRADSTGCRIQQPDARALS